MAIDSLRKRASIASLGLAFLGPSVVPDGTLGVFDRQTIAHSYYGIDSSVVGVTIGDTSQIGAYAATGGITLEQIIGGTNQIAAFDATGGVTLERTLGATSQIAAFTSSGTINAGAAAEEEQPSGGYAFWFEWEQELEKRKREKKKHAQKFKKAKKLEDKLEKQLALAERKIEQEESRKAELARLGRLVENNRKTVVSFDDPKVKKAMDEALKRQTFSTMERLEREIKRVKEEEEFLMNAAMMFLND